MYIVIRRYTAQPSKVDEIVRKVDEQLLEKLNQLSGFETYYALDSGGGKLTAITVCADESSAHDSNRLAKEFVGTWLADAGLELIETLEGKVVVHGGS